MKDTHAAAVFLQTFADAVRGDFAGEQSILEYALPPSSYCPRKTTRKKWPFMNP
jgi:hypothetical protein